MGSSCYFLVIKTQEWAGFNIILKIQDGHFFQLKLLNYILNKELGTLIYNQVQIQILVGIKVLRP